MSNARCTRCLGELPYDGPTIFVPCHLCGNCACAACVAMQRERGHTLENLNTELDLKDKGDL